MITTKFSPMQFFTANEPKIAQTIGSIALIAGTISGLIIGIPATLTAAGINNFVLPAGISHIATILLTLSVILKSVTKMFGSVTEDGTPVSTTLPSTIAKVIT